MGNSSEKSLNRTDDRDMFRTIATVCNVLAALSAIMVLVSVFMPYLNYNVSENIRGSLMTGFSYLRNENNSSRGLLMAYLTLSMIMAAAVLVIGVLRMLNIDLFNTKVFCLIFALEGIALMVLSILMFVGFVNSSSLNVVSRGAGLIVSLVFSITAMLACIGSAATTHMGRD